MIIHSVFLICFGVGAGFVILSFLIGALTGQADAGGADGADIGDLDAGFDAEASVGFDVGAGVNTSTLGMGVSPFKPMIIATFLTVFGGVGLLLFARLYWFFALPAALLAGLAAGYALLRFVYVPLYRYQSRGVIEKQKLVGLNASVTVGIPQGGFGKIKYVADGNVYSAPAKAEGGGAIARGCAVQIIYIEKNTFYVRQKQ